MLLKFKPDGTSAGFSTDEEFDLMEKYLLNIGEIVHQMRPFIIVEKFSKSLYFLAVNDGIPHLCLLCKAEKNNFVEIIDEENFQNPKLILICKDCLYFMQTTLTRTSKDIDDEHSIHLPGS